MLPSPKGGWGPRNAQKYMRWQSKMRFQCHLNEAVKDIEVGWEKSNFNQRLPRKIWFFHSNTMHSRWWRASWSIGKGTFHRMHGCFHITLFRFLYRLPKKYFQKYCCWMGCKDYYCWWLYCRSSNYKEYVEELYAN